MDHYMTTQTKSGIGHFIRTGPSEMLRSFPWAIPGTGLFEHQ